MPPLLCPSPQILDQAFPRTEDELQIIAIALGEMQNALSDQRAGIILTQEFEAIMDMIDWQNQPYPLIIEVQRLFSQLFLQTHPLVIYLDVPTLPQSDYHQHPLPSKCTGLVIANLSDELGKILVMHDQCIEKDEYFIGIACPYGFSGGDLDTYQSPAIERYFPLVGKKTFEIMLDDAYEWYIPAKMDITNRSVDRNDLERNYAVIGISHIDSEKGRGSHQMLIIKGHRDISLPKPQRKGEKNIQDYVLKELSQTLRYPIDVIKYALLEGKLPERRCKLKRLESKK